MLPPTGPELAADPEGRFPDLVDAYAPMVVTLAARLTDRSTGQDIAQEVFLRAYRAIGGYGRDRVATLDTRAWLATITRNLVRNEYRRRERRATVPLGGDDAPPAAASSVQLDAVADGDHLDQLLSALSDAQREAVVLRHIVGLPMREVALTMACPEGTAKSHVSRGLAVLRAELTASTTDGSTTDGASGGTQ